MSRLKAANNAQTTLSALMEAGADSLTVVNGDILPAAPFRVTIDNEIVEVGVKSGNNCSSILRAQEGTVAAAHQLGSVVNSYITAGMYEELETVAVVDAHKAEDVTDSGGVHGLKIEEGIWTPVLKGSSTAGTNTYSAQSGQYYKVGKLVHAPFNLALSAKDVSMAGSIQIDGLPLAVANTIVGCYFALISNLDFSAGYSQITGYSESGLSKFLIYQAGDNVAYTNITASNINNTTSIKGVIIYKTAS